MLLGCFVLQFLNLVEMLDSVERMTISARFVKYRPDVPLKGNASRWFVMQYKPVHAEEV